MAAAGAARRTVVLGLCQTSVEPYDVEASRAASLGAAEAAFLGGADIALLPELAVPGYGVEPDRIRELAEPLDGPTVQGWTALARAHGGYVAGGLCERDGDAIYDTAVVVGAAGVELHYRKLHLFSGEVLAFTAGDLGLPVLDTRFGRIGMCVCYDLRFVETVRILALRGAELVLVPTAWVPGFDDRRWDEHGMAAQAHGAVVQANLSQVFMACASLAGEFGDTTLLGASIVVDPTGGVVAGPLSPTGADAALVTIDLDDVARAQVRSPLIRPREDRRTDVYALSVDGELL